MDALLDISHLHTSFFTPVGEVRAVRDVSFSLRRGEVLGIVGESGSGKSVTMLSILRLLGTSGRVVEGSIRFDGTELAGADDETVVNLRGNRIGMIFQDPMTSLNPVITVDRQIAEMVALHQNVSENEALARAVEMLALVGIRPERAKDYPHQFSGGMKQRVVIAIALACDPALLIADEPTTALDVTIQAQVLELMKELKRKLNTSMIMITHDLGIVAETCDKVAIMYAGRVVEYAEKRRLFLNPVHPYTQGLFNSLPELDEEQEELKTIPGLMPDPTDLPSGCPFHPRCGDAVSQCAVEAPAMVEVEPGHFVACPVRARKGNKP